jgi:uncharacterized protein
MIESQTGVLMIEVSIDSINVNLVSQSRVVVLREKLGERRLPIWIGQFEAEAIAMSLQEVEAARPMTHDLLKNILGGLGVVLERVEIFDLQEDVFYSRLILRNGEQRIEIDSRPSDGIALAVRVHAGIWVEEAILARAGILPEKDIREAASSTPNAEGTSDAPTVQEERLDVFKDFIERLDSDNPAENDNAP